MVLSRKFPGLRFVADFSHFTVVCEAGPDDACLDEAVREIIPRIGHIHARIVLRQRAPGDANTVQIFVAHVHWHLEGLSCRRTVSCEQCHWVLGSALAMQGAGLQQVNDPRAPEWQQHWATFARWWSAVWAHQELAGCAFTTCTPEHGPATYQQAAPHSQRPAVDIWEVNTWVGARVRELFALRRSSMPQNGNPQNACCPTLL